MGLPGYGLVSWLQVGLPGYGLVSWPAGLQQGHPEVDSRAEQQPGNKLNSFKFWNFKNWSELFISNGGLLLIAWTWIWVNYGNYVFLTVNHCQQH